MSIFGSLFTGVSALQAQSQSMGTISNNIANVSTVGYKRETTAFNSLVTTSNGSRVFSPGGVSANQVASTSQQGLLQQSTSATDIAIAGNGMFVVRQSADNISEPVFTRAGQFQEDSVGYLRNSSGYYLMGWRLDDEGNIPAANSDIGSTEPVDVGFLNGLAAPTTTIEVGMNLQADADLTDTFNREVAIDDALGGQHTIDMTMQRTAVNEWQVVLTVDDADQINLNDGAGSLNQRTINLQFNGDGSLAAIDRNQGAGFEAVTAGDADSSLLNLNGIDWTDTISGAEDSDITMDLSALTQFSSDFSVAYVDQNGAELGLRTGVTIDEDGLVTANFSNGQTRPLYQIPLATFANANGLNAISGNVYQQTVDSGSYNLRRARQDGAGAIAPSALEGSNVDLADEFSQMIITQRAYSAGTKIVSTSDQMLSELLNIR
ncbi:MAG: flagellar hook protein FlgE [Alphaproteobacteria bacterium]